MDDKFKSFMENLPAGKIAVALSGGADSMALMHWCRALNLDITAITIDHGLRPESSAEAGFAKAAATKIGVPHHTLAWRGEKPNTGIEESAREARYGLLLDFCRENDIKILMTAHHADDNIETFLMNLGRGSGLFGLAGMRPLSTMNDIIVARPLLEVRRARLRDWCAENKVEFVDDPMNEDEKFLRVRIRKNRHLLADKLDISDGRILSALSALDRAREASEKSVDDLVAQTGMENGRMKFSADFLFGLPAETRLKFFSRALQMTGGEKYPPRLESLERALSALSADTTITLAHCVARRHNGAIVISKEN
ncbi:MAG: tRNA lysidine(34) synthetase TilS [Rickettsiales bacterium]|jgi:tRNA(Ile)-lysidine synthase|nr:tRNA lysidine(34) synthetase TilS [Rickettsiales bacterium]